MQIVQGYALLEVFCMQRLSFNNTCCEQYWVHQESHVRVFFAEANLRYRHRPTPRFEHAAAAISAHTLSASRETTRTHSIELYAKPVRASDDTKT